MSRQQSKVVKVRGPRQNLRKQQGSARRSAATNLQSPPEFISTLLVTQKLRFEALTGPAVKVPITRAQIQNLVTMATTTTVQNRLFAAAKLTRVQVWSPTASTGIPSTSSVEWLGLNSPSVTHSDTSMGMMRNAHIDTRPPNKASERLWSTNGQDENEVLFSISCPQYAIVDVTIVFRMIDSEGAIAGESGTGAGSVAGRIYLNYLDGFASKILAPISNGLTLP